jgi:Catalase
MPESSSKQTHEPLEIGTEYPPPGEEAAIEELRQLHLKIQHVEPGPSRRGEHPKQHGGIWARFQVQADIPREYRVGLFESPGNYTALVRYSNGRYVDDRQADVRGMAIKVLIPRDEETSLQQDFILANHPVFFCRNVQHTLEFLAATASGTPPTQLALTTHPALVGFTSQVKSSPLDLTYWSQTPYKCGNGAVKYLATPSLEQEKASVTLNDSPDFLREAMIERLTFQKIGATFDFFVNPQTDADAMPIEDATIEWKSSPVKLATIMIFPQRFNSPEQMQFVENLYWTPWDSLPEHKPLGGINRARQGLYQDSRELRHITNGVQITPITGRESF